MSYFTTFNPDNSNDTARAEQAESHGDKAIAKLPPWRKHGEEYLTCEPFQDEAETTCRTVELRKARKNHRCYGLAGQQDHDIQAGDFYRYERALIDGGFWGEFKVCLGCLDQFIEECC